MVEHYKIEAVKSDEGMGTLRSLFPEGKANELNFCFFSTSGVHGSYLTLEEIRKTSKLEKSDEDFHEELTFLVLLPRMVSIVYGNCIPKTDSDFEFLKNLRESSKKAALSWFQWR